MCGPKVRIGTRPKGIRWEYNWDGAYAHERWNKGEKRHWKRWRRRQLKVDLMERIDDQEGSGTDSNAHQNPQKT